MAEGAASGCAASDAKHVANVPGQQCLDRFDGIGGGDALIHEAPNSVSRLAVIPAQDLLGLGSEARLNIPGTVFGKNWRSRMSADALSLQQARHWYGINRLHDRC